MHVVCEEGVTLPGGWFEFSIDDPAARLNGAAVLKLTHANGDGTSEHPLVSHDGRSFCYTFHEPNPVARVEFMCPGAPSNLAVRHQLTRLSWLALAGRALSRAPAAALAASFWRFVGYKQRACRITLSALNSQRDKVTISAKAAERDVRAPNVNQSEKPIQVRELRSLEGHIDEFWVGVTGALMIVGWLNDEAAEPVTLRLSGFGVELEIPDDALVRYSRPDVEAHFRRRGYDYGFLILAYLPNRPVGEHFTLHVGAETVTAEFKIKPALMSNRRLLTHVLEVLATVDSNQGREFVLDRLLAGSGDAALRALYDRHVNDGSSHVVETFGHVERPLNSFITVLFGSSDPLAFQPHLFRSHKVAFGEWIYVCNSPEISSEVLRLAMLANRLYDVAVRVVVMQDNVGFGTANNIAVELARSDNIYLINPDVYPIEGSSTLLNTRLKEPLEPKELSGGLLFYNPGMLMHAGMYFDRDVFIRRGRFNGVATCQTHALELARVEHFQKGVPYRETTPGDPLQVPAISGALMAFNRRSFQALGGFSTKYFFGHYEDADLSIRWRQNLGPVKIDLRIRMLHQEGRGSNGHESAYRGAAALNRHVFTRVHRGFFADCWEKGQDKPGDGNAYPYR